MAEEISKEELENPQKITEGAILELINLWLMDYKPDDTVESDSTRPVTGKAVRDYVQSHRIFPPSYVEYPDSVQWNQSYEGEPIITVNPRFLYKITLVNPKTGGYMYRTAVDVTFVPHSEGVRVMNYPSFTGQRFTLIASDNSMDVEGGTNKHREFGGTRLVWTWEAGANIPPSNPGVYYFSREVDFWKDPNTGNYLLMILPAKKTRVNNDGVSYWPQKEDLTNDQAKQTLIPYLLMYPAKVE